MKPFKMLLIVSLLMFVCISNVYALNLGINKTIYDDRVSGSSGSWYNRGNSPGEDQEVEPGMVTGQVWDLEGTYLRLDRYLSIVGGFNLKDGYTYGGHLYTSGDIFLDTTGNAQYGTYANGSVPRNGYDYVIKVNWSAQTYNVYALSANSSLTDVFGYNSPESSPWRYNGGDTAIITNHPFTYLSGLNDAQVGVATGGIHYVAQDFDLSFLSFLPAGTLVTTHFTMECGNDNLMGQFTKVPEPTSLLLLGLGLLGVGILRRKQ